RGAAGSPIGEPPPPPAPVRPRASHPGERRVLVVGDSLARGTGDESGKGFAVDVLEALRKRGAWELSNLGVNGMESPEVLALVETPSVRGLASSADVILVSAGGNDLSHSATPGGGPPAELADAVAGARARYVENLRGILRTLREANPDARIAVVGLYDPFSGQAGPGTIGSSVILQWNALAAETVLAFPGV